MSKGSQTQRNSDETTDQLVAEHLHANPDFFERHLDLLEGLRVPHPSGSAVSLVERQVGRLQDENRRIKRRLLDLMENARENERTTDRIHLLSLALFDAGSIDEIAITVDDIFRNDFRLDQVALKLFGDGSEEGENLQRISSRDPALAPFSDLMRLRRPDCLVLERETLDFLYGDSASQIRSSVIVPLFGAKDYGLLAIGSVDQQRFQPGMGVLYLQSMGELLGRALGRYLEP